MYHIPLMKLPHLFLNNYTEFHQSENKNPSLLSLVGFTLLDFSILGPTFFIAGYNINGSRNSTDHGIEDECDADPIALIKL